MATGSPQGVLKPDKADELRRQLTSAADVCRRLGLLDGYKPGRQSGGLLIRCPVHGDRTPSCSVTPGPDRTLRVRCFGCDFSGNVFHLIAAARGLDVKRDFTEVLREASLLAGAPLDDAPSPALPAPRGPSDHAHHPVSDGTFRAITELLLARCPLAGSLAVGLASRGILTEAQADGWGELPAAVRMTEEEARLSAESGFDTGDPAHDELLAALRAQFEESSIRWLVKPRGGFVSPEHRLLIPWRAPDGKPWGLQRRYAPRYGDEALPRGPKYLWPSSDAHTPSRRFAYGVDAPGLASADELWIVEGAIDVLALRALNVAGLLSKAKQPRAMAALGIPGVESWGNYRASVLPLVKGRRVLIALDADRAGREKVMPIASDIHEAGPRVVHDKPPPEGFKDWAEISAARLWKERP